MGLRDLTRPCEEIEVLGETFWLRYPVSWDELADLKAAQRALQEVPNDDVAGRADAFNRIAACAVSACIRDQSDQVEAAISPDEALVLLSRVAAAQNTQNVVNTKLARVAMSMCGLGKAVELLGKEQGRSDSEESSDTSED